MELVEYFQSPPRPKSKRKLMDLVCDNPDCRKVFQQAPYEAKRHKLHFHCRKCHGRWLYLHKMAKLNKAKGNPPEAPKETVRVGAKPKTPQPSLEESAAVPIPE
jgi:hypothetical protein